MIEIIKLDDELTGKSVKIVFHQNNKRYALEIFMNYNEKDNDIEAILSFGENGHAGTLDYITNRLNEYIKI